MHIEDDVSGEVLPDEVPVSESSDDTPGEDEGTPDPEQAENEEDAAPSENDDAEPEEDDASGDDDTEDKPKKQGGVQKRISKLVGEKNKLAEDKRKAEYELEEAKAKLAELESQKDAVVDPGDMPKLEDYGFDEGAFQTALTEWGINKGKSEAAEEAKRNAAKEAQEASVAANAKRFEERAEKVRDSYDNFDTITDTFFKDPTVRVEDAVAASVAQSEKSADLIYHMATNPSVLDELNQMAQSNPYAAAMEIGRLADRLDVPQRKKVTTAPDPSPQLKGKDKGAPKAPADMTFKEYEAWRKKSG